MRLFILAFLLAVPTPPTFLMFMYLVSFFIIHAIFKEIFHAHQ